MFKKCSCGAEYTKKEWDDLLHIGSNTSQDEGGIYHLNMRNCAKCGSTLGVENVVKVVQ